MRDLDGFDAVRMLNAQGEDDSGSRARYEFERAGAGIVLCEKCEDIGAVGEQLAKVRDAFAGQIHLAGEVGGVACEDLRRGRGISHLRSRLKHYLGLCWGGDA